MFLNKRPNGYYYLYFKDESDNWKSVTTNSKSKIDANTFLSNYKSPEQITETTFSEFINLYLEFSIANHSPTTTTRINYVLQSFLPFIKGIELKQITPLLIEKYKQYRLTKVKSTTINIELRTLRAIFNKAIEWELIKLNPMKYIKQLHIPEDQISFITKGEFQMIMDNIKFEWLRIFVLLSVNTGMRRNELINLQWDNIDFARREIMICNKEGFTTKSKKTRIIPMIEIVYDLLMNLRNKNEYVIAYPNGEKLNGNYVTQCFRDVVKTSGVSNKIHLHSLRHTFASWLVQKGVPIYHISKFLGHAHVGTTEIYTHLLTEDLRVSINSLNSFNNRLTE